jgi:hypothetical protein
LALLAMSKSAFAMPIRCPTNNVKAKGSGTSCI